MKNVFPIILFIDHSYNTVLLIPNSFSIQIEELDFSHCKLADKGAKAVGEYLSHRNLKILHLANNDIGPEGVAGIIYGLLKAEHTTLQHLNLRLNPLLDNGMFHVCACKCTKY